MGVLGGGFLGGGFANGSSSGGGGSPSGPAGGIDVTGTYPNALDVVGLRGQPIAATAPTNGHVLTFNGTTWAPAASGLATKVDASGGTLASGTLNGSTTLDGTLTASATALLDLDAAGAEVRVPTVATTDNSTKAASTEWIATREDPSRFVRWRDECLPGVIASTIQWAVAQNGAGASVSANPAGLADSWGHRTFTTGNTSSGRAALSWETVAGQLPLVSPWTAGTLRLEWRVQLAALPTAGEDFRFSLSLGTGAGVAGDDFTSGVGIRCDSSNANWVLASRVTAVDIAKQTLSFAVAAATWTWVILDLTSTTATVYMGTTRAAALAAGARGSVTMVGATGVPVGPMSKLRKTVGTTARLAYQEFHGGELALAVPR